MKTVVMSKTGRITLPAEVRRALGIEGEAEFLVDVDPESHALTLREAVAIPKEDAWAYTPEESARLRAAIDDVHEGRVYRMSEEELLRLAGDTRASA